VLLNTFGAENVLHYDCTTDKLIRASGRLIVTENPLQERVQRLAEKRALFPFIKAGYLIARAMEAKMGTTPETVGNEYSAITGHLTGSRLEKIISPEDSCYTTVLREPLARMRSQYEHWLRTRGLTRFRVRPVFDPRNILTFEEFALLPGLQNYQTTAIDIDPARLSLIGLDTMFPEYLEELGLSTAGQEVPRLNQTTYTSRTEYSNKFIADFQNANSKDYLLYHTVHQQWNGVDKVAV